MSDEEQLLVAADLVTDDELRSEAMLNRAVDVLRQAGEGLTCPEIMERLFPGLPAEECERRAAIFEYAFMGEMPEYGVQGKKH